MRNLILAAIAVIVMASYAILVLWLVASERRVRDLERDRRAGARLRLLDKPYMLPKQQDQEIKVIQGAKEPEPGPRCEYQCSRKEVTNG